MKNFVQPGVSITVPAPSGGAVSGTGYLIGVMFGVAETTAAAGANFELLLAGVVTLPKVSAQAWSVGAAVFWDDTAKNVTTVASGNTRIGVAAAAAANPTATGAVRLNGSF